MSDKWAQLYKDIVDIKSEFITSKNFVIKEIHDMKSFNKSSFETEIINLLLNPNELLISSQN